MTKAVFKNKKFSWPENWT